MANYVTQHHNIDLTAGILSKTGVGWGSNALQTITIQRNTQKDPQQAVGYKGIVDYTSQPKTTDLTLDCILTEQTVAAAEATSANLHAETEMTLGEECYVLTSCAMAFQAGNPATVNYGYITSGTGSALEKLVTEATLLTAGEEAAFAVIMGKDGSGVTLTALDSVDGIIVLPSGVQSLNFNSSINRQQIMDVRESEPIQFITQYPIDLTMDMELYSSIDADALKTMTVALNGGTDHVTGAAGNPGALTKTLVKALGLIKVTENESVGVGNYQTFTYNFTAADIQLPLTVPSY